MPTITPTRVSQKSKNQKPTFSQKHSNPRTPTHYTNLDFSLMANKNPTLMTTAQQR
jgi:hypothetical protein